MGHAEPSPHSRTHAAGDGVSASPNYDAVMLAELRCKLAHFVALSNGARSEDMRRYYAAEIAQLRADVERFEGYCNDHQIA